MNIARVPLWMLLPEVFIGMQVQLTALLAYGDAVIAFPLASHASMHSPASGFHYTDTTNGFRAYSHALLLAPQIGFFCPCFDHHQLHYHLAIEAVKRGYRMKEKPFRRVTPHLENPDQDQGIRRIVCRARTVA